MWSAFIFRNSYGQKPSRKAKGDKFITQFLWYMIYLITQEVLNWTDCTAAIKASSRIFISFFLFSIWFNLITEIPCHNLLIYKLLSYEVEENILAYEDNFRRLKTMISSFGEDTNPHYKQKLNYQKSRKMHNSGTLTQI